MGTDFESCQVGATNLETKLGSANPKIDFNEIFLRLLQGVGGV